MLEGSLVKALANNEADVAIFTGGTGVSPRDITVEAIQPHFEKELEGFGELLRSISYAKIGAPGVLDLGHRRTHRREAHILPARLARRGRDRR